MRRKGEKVSERVHSEREHRPSGVTRCASDLSRRMRRKGKMQSRRSRERYAVQKS
jgi:hypothetical protein